MKGTVEITHGTQCTNTRAENLYGCSLCLIYWELNDRLDSKSHQMSELKAEVSGWSKLLPHAWTHSRQHLDVQPMKRHVVSWGISEPLGKLWCCLVGSDSLIHPKGSRVTFSFPTLESIPYQSSLGSHWFCFESPPSLAAYQKHNT